LMVRCAGSKRDGTPCTVTVEPPQTHCWWHDPANAQERREAASRGGKAKANPLTKELHALLEDLTSRVVDGSLVPYKGSVAAQLINTRLRLIELERKGREDAELVERLEALERMYADGGASWTA
jgi:hypothetical protein